VNTLPDHVLARHTLLNGQTLGRVGWAYRLTRPRFRLQQRYWTPPAEDYTGWQP